MKPEKILTMIAAMTAEAEAAGDLPRWMPLFADGWVEVEGEKPFLVDSQAFDLVYEHFLRRGNDIVIDYEHQTLENVQAPAAGWITDLRYRPGAGIEARVSWTARAAEYIRNREYRYFSPVFAVRKSDRRLVAIFSVALTNAPRTNNLTPILAKLAGAYEEDQPMKELLKKLVAKLKLADDAGADQVLEAIDKLQQAASRPTVAKQIIEALDLEGEPGTSEVVASIYALKQKETASVSREEFAALQAKLARREADEAVAAALSAGKITPDQKEWAAKYALRDPDGFAAFVAKAPVVVPLDKLPGGQKKAGADNQELDEIQVQINKQLGIDKETWEKYGPRQAEA